MSIKIVKSRLNIKHSLAIKNCVFNERIICDNNKVLCRITWKFRRSELVYISDLFEILKKKTEFEHAGKEKETFSHPLISLMLSTKSYSFI